MSQGAMGSFVNTVQPGNCHTSETPRLAAKEPVVAMDTWPMAEMPIASVTRYHEYMTADAAFKGFKNYREEQGKAAEAVTPNTNAGQHSYPHLTAAEQAFGKREDLIEAWTRANRRYSRPFKKQLVPSDWSEYGPIDEDNVRWRETLATARSWLHECTQIHDLCEFGLGGQLPLLPSRVIDVGHSDGSVEPKLVATEGARGRYVALSYMWGKDVQFTTTKANLAKRTSGIDVSECPLTFQDAIFACRELHCQFLWIDALCIIQDLNWEEESTKMRAIYKNSWVTILAESTPSSSGGFLRGREGHPDGPRASASLNSRGWTLQERLLAPRQLIYKPDMLDFTCQTISNGDEASDCRIPASLSSMESSSLWASIIVNYSLRQLTVDEDRLPALSGLADEVHQLTGDTYLAGLWRSHLPQALLWRIEGDPQLPFSTYLAPSWSWVSTRRQVTYTMLQNVSNVTELATVLAATTTPKNEKAPLGRVSSGSITLRGFLKRGRLFRTSSLKKTCDNPSQGLWLRRGDYSPSPDGDWVFGAGPTFSSTCAPVGTLYEKTVGRLRRNLGMEKLWAHVYLDDKRPTGSTAPIDPAYLFLIRADRRPDGGCDDLGLVLQTRDSNAGVKYERLGIFIMLTSDRDRCFGSDMHVVEVV